jgi:uncharacterized membrane protein YeaQ/YmgE (transglycosylase-associated protein family)
MPLATGPGHEITGVVARWAIGFVGSLAALLILPRLARFAFRHYAFRLIAEIVAIVSLGLLTEKVMESLAGPHPDSEKP